MRFDYVKIFALLFSDLNSSMKHSPGKYSPEDCTWIFLSLENTHNQYFPIRKPLSENYSGENCFLTNKKTDYL